MDKSEIIAIRAELQSAAPLEETHYLYSEMEKMGIPFCAECGDWHHATEDHSHCDKNN